MKKQHRKKPNLDPSGPPLPPILGGFSADSPLKIWDVMTTYLTTLLHLILITQLHSNFKKFSVNISYD